MAVETIKWLDEILVRGLPQGGFRGAHQRLSEIRRDTETGEIYKAQLLDPTPLVVADVEGVISAEVAKHLIQVDEQASQINSLLQTLQDTVDELAARKQEIGSLTEELEASKAKSARLQEENNQLTSNLLKQGVELKQLKAEIEQLKADVNV